MRAAQSNRSVRIHPGSILLSVKPFFALAIAAAAFCLISIHAAEPAPPAMSAAELADRLNAVSQGNALIRTKLEVRPLDGARRVLQLQIKQRRTKTATDLVYQVLWPDEHKGEAVILHQAQGAAKGSIIVPQQPVRAIKSSEMNEGLFGSDLSYQDAVENFFAWKKQTLVGSETINGVNCQILESKPDSSSVSIYAKVRSWIDPQRFVPMRIEKYSSSGELVRRIDVTRVARDEKHHPIPASLTVHGPRKNSVTEFNGARIDQDVKFTDADFTPAKAFDLAARLPVHRALNQPARIEQIRLGQSRSDQLQAREGNLRAGQGHRDRQRRVARKIDRDRILHLKQVRFQNAYSQVEQRQSRWCFLKGWQSDEVHLLENIAQRPLPRTPPGQCAAVTRSIGYLAEPNYRLGSSCHT